MLASVQAAVNLSNARTSEDLKRAIEGRIQALANVHSLFVESRWVGADLSTIAAQELGPYSAKGAWASRGQQSSLSLIPRKPLPCPCTSWRPMPLNMVLSPKTRVKSLQRSGFLPSAVATEPLMMLRRGPRRPA